MIPTVFLLALSVGSPPDDVLPNPSLLRIEDVQVTLAAQVRVPAREAGVLSELLAKEGDLISTGAVIGMLDSELASMDEKLASIEHEISKLQGENDVDRRFAVKSLEVAKSELQRSLASVQVYPKSVSKTELDRLRLVAEKTRLSIEQAGRDLEVAGLNRNLKAQSLQIATKRLERRRIFSPIDGMVVEVLSQPGEWLNPGDPVVRIIQLNRLRVEAFVDGGRFDGNLQDCEARLEIQLPSARRHVEFLGKVVFVSPEVQPVTGQVRLWAEVDNPDLRLRPGARGTLIVNLNKPQDSALNATARQEERAESAPN